MPRRSASAILEAIVTPAEPIATQERTLELDVVRGAALFGVLMVNLLTEFRVDLFETFLEGPPGSSLDRAVERASALALEWKSFMLFAMLFGAGLEAQLQSRGAGFFRYVVRRQAALLAIGLAHLVFLWSGDILALYAIVGAVGALLVGRPTWLLLAIGLALCTYNSFAGFPPPFPSAEAMQRYVDEARVVYAHASYATLLAFRVRTLAPFLTLLAWTAPRTLGCFLLGACAWRVGLLQRAREHRAALAAIAGLSGSAGVVAVGFVEGDAARMLGAIALAASYAATLALLMQLPLLRRALALLAPIGRMALSCYLLQSLVFSFVFYGYGLGLFDRVGAARAAAYGVAFYALQAIACAAWLRKFRFGPVEWAWRSFTYGARQPMRR